MRFMLKLCDIYNNFFILCVGLFELIDKSRMPKAVEFKHWVNNDLLPKLCESGHYNTNQDAPTEQACQMAAIRDLTAAIPSTSMDTTPQSHAHMVHDLQQQLRIKDLEFKLMNSEKDKIIEVQKLKLVYEKQLIDLQWKCAFGLGTAKKAKHFAEQEHVLRKVGEMQFNEISTTLTNEYCYSSSSTTTTSSSNSSSSTCGHDSNIELEQENVIDRFNDDLQNKRQIKPNVSYKE